MTILAFLNDEGKDKVGQSFTSANEWFFFCWGIVGD